jgi:FtsJ-like methyltransferase
MSLQHDLLNSQQCKEHQYTYTSHSICAYNAAACTLCVCVCVLQVAVLYALTITLTVTTYHKLVPVCMRRSQDYNALLWAIQQFFEGHQAVKPASSRSQSAEIFIVGTGYKAPDHIDPRMLDPKHVFDQVSSSSSVANSCSTSFTVTLCNARFGGHAVVCILHIRQLAAPYILTAKSDNCMHTK